MKKVQIWDKTSQINGIEASTVLASRKWAKDNDVILILEGDTVVEIQNPKTLKSIMAITEDKTSEEIGQAWIEHQEAEQQAQEEQQVQLKTQQEQILEKQTQILEGVDSILLG